MIPPPQQVLYEIPVTDNVPRAKFDDTNIQTGTAIGTGPKFFALYEWGTTNKLFVIDYPTGAVLSSWVPTKKQAAVLKNQRYASGYPIPIAVSSKYVAIVTQDSISAGVVSSSHLFIWELTQSGLKLVSETPIAKILNPRGVFFNMYDAYRGKV